MNDAQLTFYVNTYIIDIYVSYKSYILNNIIWFRIAIYPFIAVALLFIRNAWSRMLDMQQHLT